MKIKSLLSKSSIDLHVSASSKKDLINSACALMVKGGNITDPAAYSAAVFKREEESTTGIGDGIAIPHAKGDFVSKPGLVAMVVKDGADFDSLDGEPVKLLFLIAAPNSKDNIHLEVLSTLSKLLMDEKIVIKLILAKSKQEFIDILSAAEEARADKDKEVKKVVSDDSSYDILAVTACPTGIAHTYMAQEAIEKACEKRGLKVKVETNGADGVRNLLTYDDINNAKGIIIAADIGVAMGRFDGQKLVQGSVSKAISSSDELIDQALAGKGAVYHAASGEEVSSNTGEKDSVWHTIYKHLMAGVSHMLPFVIGGGILIAIAFLIDGAAGNSAAGSSFGSVNAIAAWFKTLGGYAFGFMIPILAGFIAYSIAGTPGLLIGFVGGALANVSDFSIGYAINGGTSVATAGFIGALFAGFAGGYLVVGLKKLFGFIPKSMDGLKPMLIYPVLGVLGIGLFMFFMNTPFQYINIGFNNMLNWLGDKNLVVLLGAILATMMATDMGGPINKAAYMFGNAMLTQAAASTDPAFQAYCWELMACVMIGGMVPPLAIALSTNLFPQKWSKKERSDGKVNYVMGLSFITEGAIPYAASYPLPVILSSMIGSCVAGILSALFKCQLMAPHGGIFVFPVVTGWLWYLVALLIGSLVGALMLGVTMKNNPNPELKGNWKGLYNVHTGEKKVK
ncbi:MAG: fructose-specific PTS transporter subunit EIIC [Bacilli bacterium]